MSCRICQSSCTSIYDFGTRALANDFFYEKDKVRKAPLELVICDKCKTIQLKEMVSPASIFSDDYKYKSYANQPLMDHFRELADYVKQEYNIGINNNNLLDIGSNDGSFISFFHKSYATGVDPTAEFNPDLNQYKKFFNREFAENYLFDYNFPKVITALNVMAHAPDIHEFVVNIRSVMSPETILIIEVQNSQQLLYGYFDQIYHEHYFYFDEKTLTHLLNQHDIQVVKYTNFETLNGGTLRVECKIGKQVTQIPHNVVGFTEQTTPLDITAAIENGINNIRNLFQDTSIITNGRPLIGIGAPAKASLMCSQIEELKNMQYCLDTTVEKDNKYIPGTNIRIKFDDGNWIPDTSCNVFIFSWNYFEIIMKKHNNFKGHNVICPHPAEIIMCY